MAELYEPGTGRKVTLGAHCVVGRHGDCDLRLGQPHVSAEHARLSWSGEAWTVRDLGSRNGTWVDGERLETGGEAKLEPGARIGFGSSEDIWILDNADPPGPFLERRSDGKRVALDGEVIGLPDSEEPELSVFDDHKGRWVAESDEGTRILSHGDLLEVGEETWQVHMPLPAETTLPTLGNLLPLSHARMRFRASGEQLSVSVSYRARTVHLEPRTHDRMLLELAKVRRYDEENPDLSEDDRGWVHREDLGAAIGVGVDRLRLLIFRARKTLAEAGVQGAGDIVERRLSTGQLRLGIAEVDITES